MFKFANNPTTFPSLSEGKYILQKKLSLPQTQVQIRIFKYTQIRRVISYFFVSVILQFSSYQRSHQICNLRCHQIGTRSSQLSQKLSRFVFQGLNLLHQRLQKCTTEAVRPFTVNSWPERGQV